MKPCYTNLVTAKDTICKTIGHYLDRRDTLIFLFGSRAYKGHHAVSDYDVGLFMGRKVRPYIMAQIKADLEDSFLPVRVDVVDFAAVSRRFKGTALQKIVLWNKPRKSLKLN